MTGKTENTAMLIFAGESFVSLPKVSDLLNATGNGAAARVVDVSLTGLTIELDDHAICLDLAFAHGETHLKVELRSDALCTETRLSRLAGLVFALARSLPVAHVVWAGTTLRIPRAVFVAGLAEQFGDARASVAAIAPRRVSRTVKAVAARPDPESRQALVARMLPAMDATVGGSSANADTTPGTAREDANVAADQAQLRATLLRVADADELKAVETEHGEAPLERRLSRLAVSMTVATVSLPLAVPVMVYNVARSDELRAASIVMGVAGLLLTLDSSGAMAAVAGF